MLIRKLELADYDTMLELYKKLDELHVEARPDYFIHRDDVFPREHFHAAVADTDCLLIGAFDRERIVGIVRATLWNESGMVKNVKTVCLDDIYVLPSYRRMGIAAKLFDAAEAWARKQKAVRLDLNVWNFNKEALVFYERMGMQPQRHVLEKHL